MEDGRVRLARLVRERRLSLGLSVRAAAAVAEIDRTTWSNTVESAGRTVSAFKKVGIEKALKWAAGSVDAILGGGDPAELTDSIKPLPAVPLSLADQIERIGALENESEEEKQRAIAALITVYEKRKPPTQKAG